MMSKVISIVASTSGSPRCWTAAGVLSLFMLLGWPGQVSAQQVSAQYVGSPTAAPGVGVGFVSLKADKVDARAGPGPTHKVTFVFQRAGLPVESLRDVAGWREVRDADGAIGWVHERHLSLRRTVLVAGPAVAGGIALKARAGDGADTVVLIEPGIVAHLVACDGTWCQVGLADVRGYLPQSQLWGVRPGEIVR